MSSIKTLNPLLRATSLTLLLIACFGFWGFSERRKPNETMAMRRRVPLVETQTVVTSQETFTFQADGEVTPYREVSLASEVAGRIRGESDKCRAGNYIRKGDLLFEIDPSDYELEVRRIQQSIEQSSVSVEEIDVQLSNNAALIEITKSDLSLQQKEVARTRTLHQQRAASRSDLDSVHRGRLQVKNTLQTLENQQRLLKTRRGRVLRETDRLETELEKAILNLNRTKVHSPVDGLVMSDSVEQGDFVQRGTTLVKLDDTSKAEVRFHLKLQELRWIQSGVSEMCDAEDMTPRQSYHLPALPVKIQLDIQGQLVHWQAVLSRYDGGRVDSMTRTIACVATVSDPHLGRPTNARPGSHTASPLALLRGMFVSVHIEVPCGLDVLEVSPEALRPGNQLWLLREGRLAVQSVRVARKSANRVLLFGGNSPVLAGDRVIVSPLELGVDGMEVRPISGTVRHLRVDGSAPIKLAASQLAMQ